MTRDGLGGAKLQILEALLRLRQAACHPGLVDRARAGDASAKLDVLVPRLQELVEDGRKVLVFSQFTTLLGLLRTRLDEADLTYEYLDGKTRDRAGARRAVSRTSGCPLFLISLKAGGLGLNLTAAEYVFLLDPVVEPGRRGAGDRPRAPHRPDAAGVRLPAHRARHGRGEGPGAAGHEAHSSPTPSSAPTRA